MTRNADRAVCRWLTLNEALSEFVRPDVQHQSAGHIKPLHWYVACRFVVEGGFRPDDITPRPPFRVTNERSGTATLQYVAELGGTGEKTVLGGLKTKNVDVVVEKSGVGPVMAVSVKGTLRAFRNLTNRMEEAAGDCANLHITYPALVYAFLSIIRGNQPGPDTSPNDIAIDASGLPHDIIRRYGDVLERLAEREGIREEASRYEAVALAIVKPETRQLLAGFPSASSSLCFDRFFDCMYRRYDERFVYSAPALLSATQRLTWQLDDSVRQRMADLDYVVREC
jgi:hypothetical protein